MIQIAASQNDEPTESVFASKKRRSLLQERRASRQPRSSMRRSVKASFSFAPRNHAAKETQQKWSSLEQQGNRLKQQIQTLREQCEQRNEVVKESFTIHMDRAQARYKDNVKNPLAALISLRKIHKLRHEQEHRLPQAISFLEKQQSSVEQCLKGALAHFSSDLDGLDLSWSHEIQNSFVQELNEMESTLEMELQRILSTDPPEPACDELLLRELEHEMLCTA